MAERENRYPGITDQIRDIEDKDLPKCPRCASMNTAEVQCGFIGRTMFLAAATTKLKLIPNGPRPGQFFCNDCSKYFD